jgi:hypothetical protein
VPLSIRVREWNLPTVPNSIRPARWSRAQASSGGSFVLDQLNLSALRIAAEKINAEFGHVDILFANAGIQVQSVEGSADQAEHNGPASPHRPDRHSILCPHEFVSLLDQRYSLIATACAVLHVYRPGATFPT